ncbi:metalloregulator ArsR/SmtB family transcription factor, partial [Actinosynnema sp. NPDC023658]|uniref:metalloregulator ArsR/SmtB family transcription factor n=1 Tax=Actinosynnema sp. NPDC023658 TaxID=3155465 RepID=UPI0033C15EF6
MDEVASAIADPVRREILGMLRDDVRLSAGQIAERFAISRPAVSRHLRVLRESGLVRDELVGRQRFYVLDASRFTPLLHWLADFAPTPAARPTPADRPASVDRPASADRSASADRPTSADRPAPDRPAPDRPAAPVARATPDRAAASGRAPDLSSPTLPSPGLSADWEHHLDALETEVYRTRRERRVDEPKE